LTSGNDREDRSPDEDRLSPEESSALRALQALPTLRAGARARERIRTLFVEGTSPGQDLRTVGERRGPSAMFRPIAVAAAVALLVVGAVYVGMQPSGQWFVTGLVEADGITAGPRPPEMSDIVLSGSLVTGPESEMEIQLADQLRFRMLAGTAIELPPPPGRWLAKARTIRLTRGEIYGTTSGERLTFSLTIETPEATARLLGTTFAAFRTEDGTCFCLWSGGIEVAPADGSPHVRVPTEHKFFVYNDGRAPEVMPIDDMERMKLSMTHEAGLAPEPQRDK
jgi:ferric-dicitrate binding protein FerR (iron transport regulator)